jgi:hypothetical protein
MFLHEYQYHRFLFCNHINYVKISAGESDSVPLNYVKISTGESDSVPFLVLYNPEEYCEVTVSQNTHPISLNSVGKMVSLNVRR